MKLDMRKRSLCVALTLCLAVAAGLNMMCSPVVRAQAQAVAPQPPQLAARLVATLAGYEGPSYFRGRLALVAFSADGQLLALSGADRTVKIFDTATGKLKFTLGTKGKFGLNGFAFAPDSKTAVTRDAADRLVRVWDMASGEQKQTFVGRKRNLETKLKATSLPQAEFTAVPVSPDGRTVLVEKEDDLVTAFDAATGQERMVLDHKTESSTAKVVLKYMLGQTVYELHVQPVYSPDGARLVTANGDKFPKLWDAATGQLIATLAGHNERVYNAAFSPDARLLATESIKGETKLWDAQTGALKATLKAEKIGYGYFSPVKLYGTPSFIFSPDSQTLVTYHDRATQIWNAQTGAFMQTLKKAATDSAAFSPDSRLLATAGDDRAAAKLWDARTGQLVRALARPDKATGYVTFSPDGRVLLTASDAGVRLWAAAGGELLLTLDKARFPARFSPDGRLLATGGTDKTALLYELTTP